MRSPMRQPRIERAARTVRPSRKNRADVAARTPNDRARIKNQRLPRPLIYQMQPLKRYTYIKFKQQGADRESDDAQDRRHVSGVLAPAAPTSSACFASREAPRRREPRRRSLRALAQRLGCNDVPLDRSPLKWARSNGGDGASGSEFLPQPADAVVRYDWQRTGRSTGEHDAGAGG